MRSSLVLFYCLLAACDDGSRATLEYDFACAGTPWPTIAPDPLRVWGRVVSAPYNSVPISGAAIELYASNDVLLGEATSMSIGPLLGGYSIDVATSGVAPTLYRKHRAAGHLDHYTNDAFALFGEFPYQGDMQTADARDSYYQQAGVAPDPAKGTLQLFFYDCLTFPDQRLVQGVTVDSPPGSTALYADNDGSYDPDLRETTSAGQVLLLNVTPGSVGVTAHASDLVYRPWPVMVRAGVWTESVRAP